MKLEVEDVADVLEDRRVSVGPYVDATMGEDTIVRVRVSSTFEIDLRRRVISEIGRKLADIRFTELEADARVRIVKALMLGEMPEFEAKKQGVRDP